MVGPTDTGPLDWRIGIVDKTGRPTPEFQRRWNSQRVNNGFIGLIATGGGAPDGTPADGDAYVDTSSTPETLYIGFNGSWSVVGVQDFIQLSDVPNTYSGAGSQLVKVTSGADGLEFSTLSEVLDLIDNTQGAVLYRGASSWVSLAPGTAGNVLSTGGPGADPSWVPQSGGGGGGALWDISAGVPALAGFTQTNFQSGTVASESSGKALILQTASAVNNNLNVMSKAVPATAPYRVAIFALTTYNGENNWPFVGWRDSSSGKLVILGYAMDHTFIQNYNSASSFNGQPFVYNDLGYDIMWLGLRDDGTNIFYEYSMDGVDFTTVYSVAKSSGFLGSSGYNEICWGLFDNQGSGNHPIMTLRCYDENGLTRNFP